MKSWNSKKRFEDVLSNNSEINKYLSEEELKIIIFSEDKIENIDWIFKKNFTQKLSL